WCARWAHLSCSAAAAGRPHTVSLHDALPISSEHHHRAEHVAGGHGLEGLVDLVEGDGLGDEGVQVEPAQVVLVDEHLEVPARQRSEEHTSELQSRENLVCRLLLGQKTGERSI